MQPNWVATAKKSIAGDMLYLVRGTDEGMAAWHFIMLRDRKAKLMFLNDIAKPGTDIANYGEVLASGWGKNPSAELLKEFTDKYSAN